MKNTHKTACMALFLSLPFPMHAQTIFGVADCGQWVRDAGEASRQNKAWLLGYLSGLNTLHEIEGLKPSEPLNKLNSADQAFLWMDNYCKAQPLKTVAIGGWELFKELKKK